MVSHLAIAVIAAVEAHPRRVRPRRRGVQLANLLQADDLGPEPVRLLDVAHVEHQVIETDRCDGFICHGFTTERYLREITIPALQRGRLKASKTMDGFEIVGPSFVVTGTSLAEINLAATSTKQQIAFYGSTPSYRGVLELHGWDEIHAQLNAMSKQGKWESMGELISDEMLNTFAVVGEPEQIAPELHKRYGDVIQRLSFYAPYKSDPQRWQKVLADMKSA